MESWKSDSQTITYHFKVFCELVNVKDVDQAENEYFQYIL